MPAAHGAGADFRQLGGKVHTGGPGRLGQQAGGRQSWQRIHPRYTRSSTWRRSLKTQCGRHVAGCRRQSAAEVTPVVTPKAWAP